MDSNSTKITHDDHPTWDRLNFSRILRQILAETARDYYLVKMGLIALLPYMDWHERISHEAHTSPTQRHCCYNDEYEVLVEPWKQLRWSYLLRLHRITTVHIPWGVITDSEEGRPEHILGLMRQIYSLYIYHY
jgi:hypothetical protein